MSNYREFRFIFDGGPGPSLHQDQIRALAEGFVRANEMAIAHDPGRYPQRIEDASLNYVAAPGGRSPHPWQSVLGAGPLMDDGSETCLGLASLHAAMLRFAGDSRAYVDIIPYVGRYGPVAGKWHAVVVTGRGDVLDTQKIVEAARTKVSA
jgi:hypothetical protein